MNENTKERIKGNLMRIGLVGGIGVGGIGFLTYLAYKSPAGDYIVNQRQPEIVQQNVLGGEQPEIYLEHKGVKYFSRVDGKSIDELVK